LKEKFLMNLKQARDDKLEKPHAHFGHPQDIVADPALSKEEKMEALETLEQDAQQLTTATQEGMMGGEESQLSDVLDAKSALEKYAGTTNPAFAGNPPAGSDAEVANEVEIERLDP
jgi:hypothetical protein